jgi:hypothetical protein
MVENRGRRQRSNFSVLPGDTANEGETHIRLFVKNSLTVWPEKSINSI